MTLVLKNEIKYDHYFDPKTKRHQVNNIQNVLHCHHYSSLYAQLALDANETELLKECARESFHKMLETYFDINQNNEGIEAKIEICSQYYSLIGLGKMVVKFLGENNGAVEVPVSHNDDGWKKKWGQYDKPVNYVTAGFIEAMFEIVLKLPARSFEAIETESIVMGAKKSSFKVTRR